MARKAIAGARQKPRPQVFKTTPLGPNSFKSPRTGQAAGASPDPPLPDEFDVELQRRWQAWQQSHGQRGSILEYICWDWLTHKKKLREHVDFFYQWDVLGGSKFTVDFYFPSARLAWFIDTVRFTLANPRDRAASGAAKAKVLADDITPIAILEQDILTRTQFVLENALEGRQVSHSGAI